MEEKKKQAPAYTYWCFTLNNYNEDDIIILQSLFDIECKWYLFQEEIGENGTIHLQGTLNLVTRLRLTSLKQWHKKIHWEPTKCIKPSILYCSKKETRNGRIFYKNINIPEEIEVCEPYGWQNDVLDIIKLKPDNRTIHWFWEPNGNVGKSQLVKYLVVKHNAIIISGKGNDIYHMIAKSNNRKLIVCDIPRVNIGHVNYTALEAVKNGLIFSGKYDSDQYVFNSPHVICFANEPPEWDNMSLDRWNVREICISTNSTNSTARGNTEIPRVLY